MKKSYKILLSILAVLVIIIVILLFKADDYIEAKIDDRIAELPSHVKVEYGDLEFSTLQGNLVFKDSKVKFFEPTTDSLVSTISIANLSILDIGYWDYLVNDKFVIQKLELNQPILNHKIIEKKNDTVASGSEQNSTFKTALRIEELVVKGGKIKVEKFEDKSTIFSAEQGDLQINEVLIDSTVGDLIPFKYESYSGSFNDLFYELSPYENLNVANLKFNSKDLRLKEVSLKTKFERTKYDGMLKQERDWFDIQIDSVNVVNSDFGKRNDSIFRFSVDSTVVYQPSVKIYRNKLLPDENEIKPFYSEVLRDLDFQLQLKKTFLENGYVSYEEKVIAEHAAGKLDFSNFYASIYNFSNTYSDQEQTTIDVKTNFMTTAPLEVNWTFDFNDTNDAYIFKADLASINTEVLNQFTLRNLNAKLEGTLNQTYFTIDGNNSNSRIDMEINYDDFRVELINDKKNRPKKLLNAIVNIFVRKDSDEAINEFRVGNATIDRNKYGSFYNNLWLNINAGLKKAITGDVKKEDRKPKAKS